MKIDRLYAITVYLLNHGRTSAAELAKHFEVSVRTIQRDIDSLGMAGIPVYAINGVNGGYEISDTFKRDNQLMSKDDFAYIITALHGFKTVTQSRQAREIRLQMLQSAVANKQSMCKSDNESGNNFCPTKVRLHCSYTAIHRIREYLGGEIVKTYDDGTVIMELYVVENEQWWIGIVLSLAGAVKVLEPEHIKRKIINAAKEILISYQEE